VGIRDQIVQEVPEVLEVQRVQVQEVLEVQRVQVPEVLEVPRVQVQEVQRRWCSKCRC